MKRYLVSLLCMAGIVTACNNNAKESAKNADSNSTPAPANTGVSTPEDRTPAAGSASINYTVGGSAKSMSASVLVQKDKSNLSPGNNYFGMISASENNADGIFLNFLFSLKPGSYPVVGTAFTGKNKDGKGEVYGALMGGEPKKTPYTVTLTQCEDMGSNGMGGHKWKISGSVDQEDVIIEAPGLVKLNKENPTSITLSKLSFANLTFDDNWTEMMEEGVKKMQNQK